MKVTMVGTFPPLKGLSRTYCVPLAQALGRHVAVDFVSFSHIYAERFYPGGTKEAGVAPGFEEGPRLRVRRPLAWFNPAGWIWTGLTIPGRVLHIHWWTFYLAHVEMTLLEGGQELWAAVARGLVNS